MKVVIIGGVAGGASAAARLRRLDEHAEIVILERGTEVSYANCGLPYWIGGIIQDEEELFLQTPESLWERFRICVRTRSEAERILTKEKRVLVRNLETGALFEETYDKLVIATGSRPVQPPIEGGQLPCVYSLHSIWDAERIHAAVEQKKHGCGVVIGGGFIGLETAENMVRKGMSVTVVEAADQIFPALDSEMASILQTEAEKKGITFYLNAPVTGIYPDGEQWRVRFGKTGSVLCDLVIMAVGVRPESDLAREAGIAVNARGGIVVDQQLRTSAQDVYAAGDVAEVTHLITGEKVMLPLAGPANKQGRILAANIAGGEEKYGGVVGASVVKMFSQTAASVGLTEKVLRKEGLPYEKIYLSPLHHAGYYPGAEPLTIKMMFAPTGRIWGFQCVGEEGVEKRVDIVSTVIQAGGDVSTLAQLELCYAPPFSSAKDPVNYAGFLANNILSGLAPVRHWEDWRVCEKSRVCLVDVRTDEEYKEGHVPGSLSVPVDQLRDRLGELPMDQEIWVYCQVGLRGYLAQRILMQNEFRTVYNLSGGYRILQMCYSRFEEEKN